MNAALAAAERLHETREAVAAIRRAGFLGPEGAARADVLWPEPGPRAGWLGRILAAVFVSGAIGMLTSFVGIVFRVRSFTAMATLACLLLVIATERILASPRFAFSGAAGTTAFWAWVAFVTASAAVFDSARLALPFVLPLAAVAALAAVVRWGFPLHAFLAAAALFAWIARAPAGRLAWVVAALALAAVLAPNLDRPAAPPHRDALAVGLATCLAALYAALNPWSVDEKIVEAIGGRSAPPGAGWLAAAWWGTLLVPLAVLAWGVASRRRWLAALGGGLLVLSAITLRHYVHLMSLPALLALAGAAVSLVALALIRLLSRRGEVAGYTDEPLLSHPTRAEALGTAALVASQLAHLPAREEWSDASRFASGGGSSGGGGASDSF